MFNSTGNNFGGGTISFKDYQDTHYVVLNAEFTLPISNPLYLAAEVLEIYVPDLSISRSGMSNAFIKYTGNIQLSTFVRKADGGTILKSWIKDRNTICIEGFHAYDDQEELTVYIQSMYTEKNTGSGVVVSPKTTVTFGADAHLITMQKACCVVNEHWVFLFLRIKNPSSSIAESETISATLEGFPTDVSINTLLYSGEYPKASTKSRGVTTCRIENGFFQSTRLYYAMGQHLDNPFIYFFAVR